MKKFVSKYIYAKKGKQLTENGKECGKLVIAPETRNLSVFGNVKEIKDVVNYLADEGKIFKNKEDGTFIGSLKEEELDKYEEVEDKEFKDFMKSKIK